MIEETNTNHRDSNIHHRHSEGGTTEESPEVSTHSIEDAGNPSTSLVPRSAQDDVGKIKSTFDTPQLHHFLDTVLETNRTMNLTSVRDPEQAWNKHIVDSLHGLETGLFDNPVRVIDIGTGAGFPGMPLVLAKPELQLTLLDSTAKKCAFLEAYIKDQNLTERIKVLLGRAEEWGHSHLHRAQYDVAITRALGSFSEVCELTLPFVKTGGHAILWRGKDAPQETQDGVKVLSTLNARLVSCDNYQLPGHEMDYHLVVLRKAKSLPGRYPRKNGVPKQQPLE